LEEGQIPQSAGLLPQLQQTALPPHPFQILFQNQLFKPPLVSYRLPRWV